MPKSRPESCGRGPVVGLILAMVLASVAGTASAQSPAAAADPLRFEGEDGWVKLGLMAGWQIVTQDQAFWNLARALDPASAYRPSMSWGEAYVKPSLLFERRLSPSLAVYGGLSVIGSGSLGRDVFDSRNQGFVGLEEGYVGLRYAPLAAQLVIDLSAGAQPYRVGSGMLISDGAADGFERGALIFGARQAFAMTAIARGRMGPASVEAFYLRPNELRSADTRTELVGAKAEWTLGPNQMLGVAYGQVMRSTAPYPQAAPGGIGPPLILADGRAGLHFLQGYVRFNPLPQHAPGLWVAGDAAVQWNTRNAMRAWGARVEAGYAFTDMPWRPVVSYAWQTFSGDKPGTAGLERFDPLFYDGSPGGWATGSNASMVFINSNVNAHRLSLRLTVTPQDLVTARYAHVRANELNSPLQFGQATRLTLDNGVPAVVTGVRHPHLSDDFLVEYTRILGANTFLTLGAAYSIPGVGLKDVVAPRRLSNWAGAFANLVVRY